ncbi:MAG: hypothetical protein RIF39_06160, partial [Cyclobacteriaceae bacterium]
MKLIIPVIFLLSLCSEVNAQSCWFNIPNAVCGGSNLAVQFSSSATIHNVTVDGMSKSPSISGTTMNINISGLGTGEHSIAIVYTCGSNYQFTQEDDSFWVGSPSINPQSAQQRCSGQGVNIYLVAAQVAPGMNYAWTSSADAGVSGNTNGQNVNGYISDVLTGSGVVTYSIFTKLGSCESLHKTFTVAVDQNSSVGSGISGPSSVCVGGNVTLTATGNP